MNFDHLNASLSASPSGIAVLRNKSLYLVRCKGASITDKWPAWTIRRGNNL